jgi:multicomponent Na+:H+ antiporter subunit G
VNDIVAASLMTAGGFFLFTGLVGLIRLPDFYSRAHAVGMMESLGILLVMSGLAVHEGLSWQIPRIVLIILFAIVSNTTALFVIMRVARRRGISPEVRPRP